MHKLQLGINPEHTYRLRILESQNLKYFYLNLA